MIKLLDFSNWNEYEGASEGSGRSEKIWLSSPDEKTIGLFKYPKPSDAEKTGITSEHISEHIAYQLGLLLGIPTARIDIGYYLGRIGCMSYLIPSPQESIKEGIEFISGIFPGFDSNNLMDVESSSYYNIHHIFDSTNPYIPGDVWIEMMLFDFIIGNSDRHQSNWALLCSKPDGDSTSVHYTRCPLYDNGSSLCCYESNLEKYFGKDQQPFEALVNTQSRSMIRIDGTQKAKPTHSAVVSFLLETYPISRAIAQRFLEKLTSHAIESVMAEYPADILDTRKNELITRFLKRKVEILSYLLKGG